MAQKGYEIIGLDELQSVLLELDRMLGEAGIVRALFHGGLAYEREVKKHIRKQHLILTGNYRTSIAAEKRKDEVWIYTAVIYAAIHEFGGTIRARRAPFLVFEVDGHLVMVKSVTIPARPHWRPAIQAGKRDITKAIVGAVRVQLTQIAARSRTIQ